MDEQPQGNGRYWLWIWKPTGYELKPREGTPPAVGSELSEGELQLRVTKIGPSPLPGDSRPCAYTIAAR